MLYNVYLLAVFQFFDSCIFKFTLLETLFSFRLLTLLHKTVKVFYMFCVFTNAFIYCFRVDKVVCLPCNFVVSEDKAVQASNGDDIICSDESFSLDLEQTKQALLALQALVCLQSCTLHFQNICFLIYI